MKKGGEGGARTFSGLLFESRTSIREAMASLAGYDVRGNEAFFQGRKVAAFYPKHSLYSQLLKSRGIRYEDYISRRLLPDDAVLVSDINTLFIVEMKFQEVEGSVDEKLQTCDFKYRQYKKLMAPLSMDVRYVYVLNNWFTDKKYKDVLNYIEESGCHYFFNEIPLDFLGLPEFPD